MTVKQLLNFIAIEVEAGRLSEDAQISTRVWGHGEYVNGRIVESDAVSPGRLFLETEDE